MKEYGFNTTLLHGTEGNNPHGATQVPIYQSSAFRHDTAEELEKIFSNKMAGYSYTRINNPTIESFDKTPAKLEKKKQNKKKKKEVWRVLPAWRHLAWLL